MSGPCAPTLAGFQTWAYGVMGFNANDLAADATIWNDAFCTAMATAPCTIQRISPILHREAVYNLAGSNLLNYAPDNAAGTPPSTFFSAARKALGIGSLTPGVIQSSSDQGTSNSLVVPDFFKELSLLSLQLMQDPYGRRYLALAQEAGTIWGIS